MGKLKSKSYDLEQVLRFASAAIRADGAYVSKQRVFDNLDKSKPLVATATRVRLAVELGESIPGIGNEDAENAKAGIEYLRELEPKNDFEESLKRLVSFENRVRVDGKPPAYVCADRDIAFACCVHMGVNKQRKRVTEVAAAIKSEYIGEIGKRDEFFVKLVEHIYSAKADYNIYRLQDRNGNLGLFFSNHTPEDLKVQPGDCLLMKMTPKRQDVSRYHGGKETVFNRIKIVKNVGAASVA